MAFEMRQDKEGVVIGQMLAHNILVQMEPVFHRDFHLSELVHNIAGRHCFEAVVFDGFPMLFWVHSSAFIGGAAFNNRTIERMDQRANQLRMQIVVPARLAGGNFYPNFAFQFHAQRLVNPEQTFRGDRLGKKTSAFPIMKHTFPSIDMIFLCQIGRCSLSSGQSHRSARSHRLQAMQSGAALPFWAARASASSHPSSQPPAAYSSGAAGQRGRYVRSALSRNIIYEYRPCFKR